ncbi:hypothetical protein [Clostridium grantii]|uniref:Uncharacterized protein n=1 Tax=Clostridium grantii DSM 8605 TaxID=1121316 RepID=A0A1M5XN14_9CLOT|nr:hypothetical protein [Clostridium grantii]SHI01139.1 hypothetical protein SAMN02745207_03797 [Clostridium grantii DSM 8605]
MENSQYYNIDKFLELIDINIDMETSPELIAKVLKEDMLLFDFQPARNLLAESLEKPVSLKPMFEKTREAIVTKQPAICEFLKEAIEAGLISEVKEEKSKNVILKSIHHSYILDILSLEIVKNIDFVVDIQEYLLKQRSKFGIRTNFIDALEDLKKLYRGSMFEPTKIVGMDMVYRSRAAVREKGVINEKEIKAQQDGLKLNILEASVTDDKKGFSDNALVGAVLSQIAPDTVSLSEDENKVMLFHLSRKWVSLYETWNLAFITGNLEHLQLLYPKLLIPSVIGAEQDEYLITRSAALWLSTLFHQFAALNRRENAPVPNKAELAKLWGKINLKYAEELAKEAGKELNDFKEALNISMGDIMETMKHSISSVPLSKEESQRLAEIYT